MSKHAATTLGMAGPEQNVGDYMGYLPEGSNLASERHVVDAQTVHMTWYWYCNTCKIGGDRQLESEGAVNGFKYHKRTTAHIENKVNRLLEEE